MPADSAKGPRGAVDSAGDRLLGAGEFGLAAGAWHGRGLRLSLRANSLQVIESIVAGESGVKAKRDPVDPADSEQLFARMRRKMENSHCLKSTDRNNEVSAVQHAARRDYRPETRGPASRCGLGVMTRKEVVLCSIRVANEVSPFDDCRRTVSDGPSTLR